LVTADKLEEPVRVTGLSDDLEARALQEAGEPFTQEDVVVGNYYTRRASCWALRDPYNLDLRPWTA
jgi:hypothetical protein